MLVLGKLFGKSKILRIPPNSPDLRQLDYYAWGATDKKIQANNQKTMAGLKREVAVAWASIDTEEMKKAISNWSNRLAKCIGQRGDRFERML